MTKDETACLGCQYTGRATHAYLSFRECVECRDSVLWLAGARIMRTMLAYWSNMRLICDADQAG